MKLRIDSIEELREFLNLISEYQPETAREADKLLQTTGCCKKETDIDLVEETPETDIDGVEWNPAVHSMGKTKTKEGRWRVKKGLQPVDENKTNDFADQVKKKYISRLEEGELSIEEMMDIFDENGLLSIDDIEKQPQDILELLDKYVSE